MSLSLLTTTAFEKDLKRVGKQGRNLDGALELPIETRLAFALSGDGNRVDAGPSWKSRGAIKIIEPTRSSHHRLESCMLIQKLRDSSVE